MTIHISPLARVRAPTASLIDVADLVPAHYDARPDPSWPAHRIAFGTSDRRGAAFAVSSNEWTIALSSVSGPRSTSDLVAA